MPTQATNKAATYEWIAGRTPQSCRVLDLGCGDGELLGKLVDGRHVEGTGIEISQAQVIKAVQRGLSVHHGDAEEGLCHYPDRSFDLVIMSLAVQELEQPLNALRECFRVGRQVIVVFPCFAHWKMRWQLAVLGQAPVTGSFPHSWYSSPNKHYLTVADWEAFCRAENWRVLDRGFVAEGRLIRALPNLRAEVGLYLMARRTED